MQKAERDDSDVAAALPLAPVAYESGGAFRHALVVVDHKPLVFARFGGGDFGAELFRDAAPALELVRVGRAGGHADALVVVIAAGDARRVVVGRRAAPQALGMAALVLVRAGSLAARAGAHCKTGKQGGVNEGHETKRTHRSAQRCAFLPRALEYLCKRSNSCKTDKLNSGFLSFSHVKVSFSLIKL